MYVLHLTIAWLNMAHTAKAVPAVAFPTAMNN